MSLKEQIKETETQLKIQRESVITLESRLRQLKERGHENKSKVNRFFACMLK